MQKNYGMLNNTLADVSKREQICCVDNAPDDQDLKVPPVGAASKSNQNQKNSNK